MKNTILKSIILSLALIAGANSAWAGAGIFYGQISLSKNGREYVAHTDSYSQPFELGDVSSLSLNATYTKVWKDNGSGNICSTVLYYKLYSSSKEVIKETPVTTSWSKNFDNTKDSEWKKEGIDANLIQNLTPGESYTLEFWFKATGSNSNGNDCNEEFWLSNSGGNYKVNFRYVEGYTITLVPDSHGTYNVTCGSTTVTSKLNERVYLDIPVESSIRISTNTPNAGYAQTHGAAIQYGEGARVAAALNTDITITGDATITGNFVSAQAQKVYLQPTTIWATNAAAEVYRAYVFHDSGNEWLDATAVSITLTDGVTYSTGDNVREYEFTIPAGYHSVIFCRVANSSVSDFNSNDFWNKTNDLLIPVGQATNCCKITKMGEIPTGGTKPDNCESVWKVRTFDVNVYSSTFGEYGFVYEDVKYFSPASTYKTYEVPQGARVKIFSTPYSDAFSGDVMTNVSGERDELLPGEYLTISGPTNMDDNYKTSKPFVVYLATPVGESWDNKTGKNHYLYAYHSRTENNKGSVVKMDFVKTTDTHHYYRCTIPTACNTIRFEKRSDQNAYVSNNDLRTVDLKYQIPINSINCYRLSGVDKDINRTDSSHYEGLWESTPGFYGDWRLVHKKSQGVDYPSDIVRNGTESQIVSLHINPVNAGNEYPRLVLQMNDGNGNWVGKDSILVKDIATITNDSYEQGRGVWNFVIKKSGSTMSVDYNAAERYTGNYYIRTNNAEGAWRFYTLSTNKMTYSSYAKAHSGYTHYFCRWVGIVDNSTVPGKNNNVKFIVANEYGAVISNELAKDDYTGAGGILPENANVRWTWDERTNEVKRAYIMGSDKDHLMLSYRPVTGAAEKTVKLQDKENWIYEIELEDVKGGSEIIALSAQYPSTTRATQFFIQNKDMITSSNDKAHKVRVMYDFKTNQTSVMLVPDNSTVNVGIDVLIERVDQGDATQVTSPIKAANDDGYTVYAAMTFSQEHIESETATEWERLYYWVSFPFDVRISDVFGFGEYGKQWIIQYYNGAKRARNGYLTEDQTFWSWISDTTYNANKDLEDANGNPCNGVMVANRGYVLALAKSIAKQGIFKNNNEYVRLYFPSMHKIDSIDGEMQDITELLSARSCSIAGREVYDSHWHMIGAPSYANKNVEVTQENVLFYYAYDAKRNDYDVQSTGQMTFKSMHSYMVQYAGVINWSATAPFGPQQVAARRNADYEEKVYNLGLQLMQDDQKLDHTLIRMQEDNATADFDMNLDLTKMINSGANIYSLAGANKIELAGNVLPTEDVTIPIGVLIRNAGEYTFSMPAGTDGMEVELIDYEQDIRTNLLLSDYTTSIAAGKNHTRFALSVKPSKITTDLAATDENTAAGVKKYIINGQLIIQHDGQLYNAIGEKL